VSGDICVQARDLSLETGYAYSDIQEFLARGFTPDQVRVITDTCDKLDPACPGIGHFALRSFIRIIRGEILFGVPA
jgi:hypothetical protein